MSRSIRQFSGGLNREELELRDTAKGKLILTRLRERLLAALLYENRLLGAALPAAASVAGAVYLGKVKNVVKNIDACFVDIGMEELCFLPFSECQTPFLTNRIPDGRILEGDELLVQIVREPLKTKQAAVTAKLSLAGRFLVFSAGSDRTGVSGKITPERKKALLQFMEENGLLENGKAPQEKGIPPFGIILRTETAPEGSEESLAAEYQELRAVFTGWFRKALHLTCFSCLREPEPSFKAAVSGFYPHEYREVVTDQEDLLEPLQKYFHEDMGRADLPIRLYRDDSISLLKLYSLETKLKEALSPRVWLKSGGYLVIEQTEALTVIDVNTGKCTTGKNSRDTFPELNREAAREAALQLRLRSLSGIIIIDFINLASLEQQEELLQYMRSLVKQDSVRTTAVDITALGLMEITRKKRGKTLREQLQDIF